jgi:hypothetical protein
LGVLAIAGNRQWYVENAGGLLRSRRAEARYLVATLDGLRFS